MEDSNERYHFFSLSPCVICRRACLGVMNTAAAICTDCEAKAKRDKSN